MVRPVWIALAGTTVPADIKERCRRSFKHIRRYFLENVGKTFQVAELEIIKTHLTAEYFQEFKSVCTPLIEDLNHYLRKRGYKEYNPNSMGNIIFCFNLVAFIKEILGADSSQAWVIFVPAGEKHRDKVRRTGCAFHIYPGGYAIISACFLGKEFKDANHPASLYPLSGGPWGSGEKVEGLIAHELGHLFRLAEYKGEFFYGKLMGLWSDKFTDCILSLEEKWILPRSPFFTEKEL